MAKTKIEWVVNPDGTKGETWNPVSGCSHASDGCRFCYTEAMTRRFDKGWKPWTAQNADHNVKLHPDRLKQPLHWRKPRKIFVCSMGDLFHGWVPTEFIAVVFSIIATAKIHTFQILTKRPERMEALLKSSTFKDSIGGQVAHYLPERAPKHWYHDPHKFQWPLPNAWLGTTVENDKHTDRIESLFRTPAAKRFVSIEPMLGPIDLTRVHSVNGIWSVLSNTGDDWQRSGAKLDWVIVGGESGPKARPMNPDWVRSIRDQCQAAGVPFFFKQWGEWLHESQFTNDEQLNKGLSSKRVDDSGGHFQFVRVGKKAAGRELDGRTWEEMPNV